jgi:hypothetical protein
MPQVLAIVQEWRWLPEAGRYALSPSGSSLTLATQENRKE